MAAQYEYAVITVPANDATAMADELNVYGHNGWELVSIEPLAGSSYSVIFKRDKK